MFVHENRSNDSLTDMEMPCGLIDVCLTRIHRAQHRREIIERAKKALGECALKLLSIGSCAANGYKSRAWIPYRVA